MLLRPSALALVLAGCVSSGPLSETEARALSTRTWTGAIDDVFDATWLTLEARGFEVIADDRLAGTLTARRDGRDWAVDVAAVGTEQRVVLTPSSPVPRAELSAVLDVLDEGTARLLSAWADLPEWKFDGRKNALGVPGFHLSPPEDWAWLDFDLSRRVVTVQKLRARTGPNPTLLVELDRTRPRSKLLDAAKKAIALSVSARSRLAFPDDLKPGTVRVLDGTTPLEVTFRADEWTHGAWQIRFVTACPGTECIPLPKPVQLPSAAAVAK